MKKLFIMTKFLAVVALFVLGLSACTEESGEMTPGKITTSDSEVDLYSMAGVFELPINVENPNSDIDVSSFGYENVNITYGGDLDDLSDKKPVMPFVKSVRKNAAGKTVLVMEYDYSGYTSAAGSFTLVYLGTNTSMSLSFNCSNVVEVDCTPFLAGVKGKLAFDKSEGDLPLPEGLLASMNCKNLTISGEHAKDVILAPVEGEDYMSVLLNQSFVFTDAEKAAGYAVLPVEFMLDYKGGSQLVRDNVKIYPFGVMESVTIPQGAIEQMWDVRKLVDELGVDKHSNGDPAITISNCKSFVAKNGELLGELQGSGLFISYGNTFITDVDPSTGELVQKEIKGFKLRGVAKLAAGQYDLVVRVKKHIDANDNKYVDFYMPFVK